MGEPIASQAEPRPAAILDTLFADVGRRPGAKLATVGLEPLWERSSTTALSNRRLIERINQFEQLLRGIAQEHGVPRSAIHFELPDLSVEDPLPTSVTVKVQRQFADGLAEADANFRVESFLLFGVGSAMWYGRVRLLLRDLEVDGVDEPAARARP